MREDLSQALNQHFLMVIFLFNVLVGLGLQPNNGYRKADTLGSNLREVAERI
jgi:hypothetical protein